MSTSTVRLLGRVVAIGALLLSGAAAAHEGEDHSGGKTSSLKGTVATIADDKLTVKDSGGKSVTVHLDDKTKYENGGAAGTLADLKAGVRVVVQGHKMKDGDMHAMKVRFGKAGAKPAAPAAKPAAEAAKPAAPAAKPADPAAKPSAGKQDPGAHTGHGGK